MSYVLILTAARKSRYCDHREYRDFVYVVCEFARCRAKFLVRGTGKLRGGVGN